VRCWRIERSAHDGYLWLYDRLGIVNRVWAVGYNVEDAWRLILRLQNDGHRQRKAS